MVNKIIKITEEQYRAFINADDLNEIKLNKITYIAKQSNVNEDVFINNLKSKGNKNTATLTYNKSTGGRNKGNKNSFDYLKTDRMDNVNGNNTYEVPLKGGLMSFNITDINGTEVMHYFKKRLNNEKAMIKMGNTEYNLEMADPEFNRFMETFINKVSAVVEYQTKVFQSSNKNITFDKVSIYPVPSSSDFNVEMANRITKNKHTINGLPTQKIDREMLKKNTDNLQKDEEFISNNSDYYNSNRWKTGDRTGTHLQGVNTDLNRLSRLGDVRKAIDVANEYTKIENRKQTGSLLYQLNYVTSHLKDNKATMKSIQKLRDLYVGYTNAVNEIRKASTYYDEAAQTYHTPFLKSIATAIKYSKGPSIEGRTDRIFEILSQYGLDKGLEREDVCMWQPLDFQIKKFGNDTRMALKNYFQPNNNSEIVNTNVEQAKSGVVVVFDDNISGGATLSDICMNLKKLGLEYIIPITFGRMRESYTQGVTNVINQPEGGFNYT